MTFRELLQQKNCTQQKLANELGITQIAVSKWVCGKSVPTSKNVMRIAEILKTDVAELVQMFYVRRK